MKNNKGFTLVEVLAVIIIIALIGGIAIPNVIRTINNSKNKAEEQMIDNIKTAAEALYNEIEYNNGIIFDNGTQIKKDEENKITVSLQTLVAYGFLKGTSNLSNNNKSSSVTNIINPKTKKEIGNCKIIIEKKVNNNNYKVTYTITKDPTSGSECPNF